MLTKTNQTGLFDGNKGRLLLEIAKTFKGDYRFKLDKRFKDDVEVDKLPEKFKKIVEKEVVEKALGKTKKIEKARPPLIITRFYPGTENAEKIIKKAEGRRNYVEGLKKSEKAKIKKAEIKSGIDKIKKAERMLNKRKNVYGGYTKKPYFKLEVHGMGKQAFEASDFKLFE